MDNNTILTRTFGVLLILWAIGFSLFFSGCNSHVSNKCYNGWEVFQGKVYKTEIINETCISCAVWKDKKDKRICLGYSNYTCYTSYVYAVKNNKNESSIESTCRMSVKQRTGSMTYAKEVAMRYSIHEEVSWYRKSPDKDCSNGGNMEKYWYVGLVLLCISICPIITLLQVCLELYGEKRYRINTVLPYEIHLVKMKPQDTTQEIV